MALETQCSMPFAEFVLFGGDSSFDQRFTDQRRPVDTIPHPPCRRRRRRIHSRNQPRERPTFRCVRRPGRRFQAERMVPCRSSADPSKEFPSRHPPPWIAFCCTAMMTMANVHRPRFLCGCTRWPLDVDWNALHVHIAQNTATTKQIRHAKLMHRYLQALNQGMENRMRLLEHSCEEKPMHTTDFDLTERRRDTKSQEQEERSATWRHTWGPHLQ